MPALIDPRGPRPGAPATPAVPSVVLRTGWAALAPQAVALATAFLPAAPGTCRGREPSLILRTVPAKNVNREGAPA